MITYIYRKVNDPKLIIAFGVLGLIALLVSLHDFVQIWDGHIFLNCAIEAAKSDSSLLKFTCAGLHSGTGFYLALLGKVTLLNIEAPYLSILFQLTCLLIAGFYFTRTLNILFPADNLKTEKALVLLQFFFSPLVAANLFYLSLDFPVLCLVPMFLYFILSKKYLQAGLCISAAYFCKTTGFMYLQLVAILYIFIFFCLKIFKKNNIKIEISQIFLLLPILVDCTISIFKLSRPIVAVNYARAYAKPKFCWSNAENLAELFLNLQLSNKIIQNYLFNIFALNFNWIGSLIIIAFGLKVLFGIFVKSNILRYFDFKICFIILALFAGAYTLTRCPHYNNPKYVITTIPVFLSIYFFCLLRLFPRFQSVRLIIILAFLTLQILSILRTIDPVSKSFYGTFAFGKHHMLHMTSRTNEYCGAGRDQTIYNLEFTKYHFVLNKIFEQINPSEKDVISADPDALWRLVGTGFNKETKTRNSIRSNSSPRFISHHNALVDKIEGRLFFIEFPFILDKKGVQLLSQKFKVLEKKNYDLAGYVLEVTEFATLKN